MPARTSQEELWRQAPFVFVATVQKLRASNVAEVEDTRRTVVAHVDRVEKGPQNMARFVGRDVTIKLATGETVREQEQARFFTNGWLFAETLAVESLGHEPVEPPATAPRRRGIARAAAAEAGRAALAAAAAAGEEMAEPAARLKASAIAERLAGADVVVRGRVTAVRVAQTEAPPRRTGARGVAAAAAAAPVRRRISEHDPEWREAEIEVDEVVKGGLQTNRVVVRFPGSNDVRWYKAPKFEPGQEGSFILQKSAAPATAAARRTRAGARSLAAAAGAAGAETFTALDPDDFQPAERGSEVRALAGVDRPDE